MFWKIVSTQKYTIEFYLSLSSENPEILEYADFCIFDRDLSICGVPDGVSVPSVCDFCRFLNLLV